MPGINLKHVVSCSSEDSTHKADNLLSSETYRKWKAARPGEKQISVILQLEKEEQVHSIDIGNEGSAFIEVLVGNSTSIKDQDFEVLLVTSSFMGPSESRGNLNLNRVRFFGPQQLVKSTSEKKWDRVKIICTQPYSKNIAYGMAFIKFHSPPDNNVPTATPPKLSKLGQFLMKDESQSSDSNLQPGSLFLTRESKGTVAKGSPKNTTLSYAAVALQTEPSTSSSAPTTSPQAAVSIKRKFEFSKERQDAPPPAAKKRTPPTKPSTHTSTSTKTAASSQKSPVQKSSVKPRPQSSEPIPFSCIMEGVVFVLSGFQNPFRSELRDKALSMGGRYRPDWTPDSTHLICAFANTPKYSQVKAAGGLIVWKEWVIDCHKRKQKISYKRYLIDGAESSSEEEEEEDEDEEEEQKHRKRSPQKRQRVSQKFLKEERSNKPMEERDEERDDHHDDNDGSDMDTEDELRRVERRRAEVGQEVSGSGGQDIEDDLYGGSTDENTDAEAEEDKPVPELPDFLSGKHFYLYGMFPENQRRLLQRYIIAFNGAVEDYMNEKVQFVVTDQGWDDSFEDALMENEKLSFVKPNWIFAINDRQKLLPHQPYTVVP